MTHCYGWNVKQHPIVYGAVEGHGAFGHRSTGQLYSLALLLHRGPAS